MRIVKTVARMQTLARDWQRKGQRIACVPTMGYLHEGHVSLAQEARRQVGKSGKVVVSIYVNPTQFGPNEDLSRYPRDFKRDCQLCRAAGVDAIFAPSNAEMYPGMVGSSRRDGRTPRRAVPATYSTYIVEEKLSRVMEGVSRPTHFRGVTTVVAKLLNAMLPDFAVFGAKDFQQAAIVKRMVRDLNFPLQIVVVPTVREPDGLAMSSRNKYLDPEQRAQAVILFHALHAAKRAVARKSIAATRLKRDLQRFFTAAPLARLDYVEFFDHDTLHPIEKVKRGAHMALAAYFGKTRLIDNARL